MRNSFVIERDRVRIFLNRGLDTLVDLEDLEMLIKLNKRLTAVVNGNMIYVYVEGLTSANKHTTIPIHRILFPGLTNEFDVDHIHHNGLDNRKSELRIISHQNNTRNKGKINSNNTTGYRNVCWDKRGHRYVVNLRVNGKCKLLGHFTDVQEAGRFAAEMRQKYYGEYAGIN